MNFVHLVSICILRVLIGARTDLGLVRYIPKKQAGVKQIRPGGQYIYSAWARPSMKKAARVGLAAFY